MTSTQAGPFNVPRFVGVVQPPAFNICPVCGFANHPDANIREADDGLVPCNNCGLLFRETPL